MVDPVNLTRYDLSDAELEEYILFGIAAAGKSALPTARALQQFLSELHLVSGTNAWQPFQAIRQFDRQELAVRLKKNGIGCYNQRARSFHTIAHMELDLQYCTPEELERCPGIRFKTSRLFILHTRRNARVACLDTHILKHLRILGYDAPISSPQSRKKYLELEAAFLELAKKERMSVAELDLMLWRKYSGNVA